jgi:Putative zinc-finger
MRASISAALDEEVSEFESLVLRAHLDRCATCREFAAATQRSTMALRAAPLEPLGRALVLPSKRGIPFPRRVPAAAAAAVLMVAFGGVFESLHGGASIRDSRPSQAAFDNRQDMLAIARRQQQANYQQLLVRRAQYESNQIPRHPGFQP